MPHNRQEAERLLVLTFLLESAVNDEDWPTVQETFRARAELLDAIESIPQDIVRQIGTIEARALATLRQRLVSVRVDMRNLSAALRIASPYSQMQRQPTLSLAS